MSPCQQSDRISSFDTRLQALEAGHAETAESLGEINGKLGLLVDGLLPRHGSGMIRIDTKWGKVRGPAKWVALIVGAGAYTYARAKGWI